MRRVTSFCVLVASMLILIQGARSEHAFRQNDRPPNVVENDADKYNKPIVSAKLPITLSDKDGMCPIKIDAGVESAKTTENVADTPGEPLSQKKGDSKQKSTRISRQRNVRQDDRQRTTRRNRRRNIVRQRIARMDRRRDATARNLVRQRTARVDRRRDSTTRNLVRQKTARIDRQRDTTAKSLGRQRTARIDRRTDTPARTLVRKRSARIDRRRDTLARKVVGQTTARRHRQTDIETRRARRTISLDSRRSNRQRLFKLSRSISAKRELMQISTASTRSRSTRREVRHSRRNRIASRQRLASETRRQAVSHRYLPATSGERRSRVDVRRRIRHSVNIGQRSVTRDEVPRDSYDQLTMQTRNHRSGRRVTRRARQTRGYTRFSYRYGFKKENSEDDFFNGLTSDGFGGSKGTENIAQADNPLQCDVVQPNTTQQTAEQTDVKDDLQTMCDVNEKITTNNNPANDRNDHAMLNMPKTRQSRSRRVESRSRRNRRVESRSGSRQGARQSTVRLGTRRERNVRLQHRRLSLGNFNQPIVRRSSARRSTRRSDNSNLSAIERNVVTDSFQISTRRVIRSRRLQRVARPARETRRIARAEVRISRSSMIREQRPLLEEQSSQLISSSEQLREPSTRSRRNSVRGRRRREVRSRRQRHGLQEERTSQFEHHDTYTVENHIDLQNSRPMSRRMSGSRRYNRRTDKHRSLPSLSTKAMIVTTKVAELQHPNKADGDDMIKHVPEYQSKTGIVNSIVNYMLSCVKDYQNIHRANESSLSGNATEEMNGYTRGVILGVAAILSSQMIHTISAPALSLGQIRQNLIA